MNVNENININEEDKCTKKMNVNEGNKYEWKKCMWKKEMNIV